LFLIGKYQVHFSALVLNVLVEEHAVMITIHPTPAVGSFAIMRHAVR